VFRRRSSDSPALLDGNRSEPAVTDADQDQQVRSSVTPKKAGPTPKRSDAEANRRGPYQAPTDRKSAYKDSRSQTRVDRTRRAQALQRGEEWALPAKDRGPVRALARDIVDSRRGLSEYYLIAVIPVFVLIFLPIASLKLIADGLVLAVLLVVAGEGIYVGRKVAQIAHERYPGQSTRGIKLYAAMRGTQLRKLRMPKPRVDRGQQV
jgi:hypothetical protein